MQFQWKLDRTYDFCYENPFNCRVKIIWVLKVMVISKAQILKNPRVLFKEQGQGSWLIYMYKNQTVKKQKSKIYNETRVCMQTWTHTYTHMHLNFAFNWFQQLCLLGFSEDFAALLSSGQLTAKGSIKVEMEGVPFAQLLARLSFYMHFKGESTLRIGSGLAHCCQVQVQWVNGSDAS